MFTVPTPDFCLARATEILTHTPERASEATAWALLAIATGETRPVLAGLNVAKWAVMFLSETSADTFTELQNAVKEYLNESGSSS